LSRIGNLLREGLRGRTSRDHPAGRTMARVAVAVVVLGAPFVALPTLADADPVSTAKAQVAQQESRLVAAGAHIRQLTLAYEQDSVQASTLAQQVARDRASIGSLQGQLDQTVGALRQEAILSYVGGTDEPLTETGTGATDPAVRSVYLQIATGDEMQVEDTYRGELRRLASQETSLAAESRSASTASSLTATAREEAISQAADLQSEFSQLQGHLTELLAAQRAVATPARPTESGPPANQGLVKLVRSIVSQTPAPVAPAPPPTPVTTIPTVTTVPTVTAPTPSPTPPTVAPSGGVWLELRICESGNDYTTNTGNGYYGAYQFSEQTWLGLGLPGYPYQAPPAVQDAAAAKLQAEVGWGAWPACSAALGL
jgi:hypothetical protein